MRKIAWGAFFLLLFTIPWENVVLLPGVGTVSRLVGLVALPICLMHVVFRGRLRFHWILFWFAAFTAWVGLTTLWVQSGEPQLRAQTFAQLLILVGLMIQMIERREDVANAFLAVVLGCYVTSISSIQTFLANPNADYQRFAAMGFNPNDMAMTLSIGIALAWWLAIRTVGVRRLIGFGLLPFAYAAVFLSASRGGFLATVAASFYPVMLMGHRHTWRRALAALVLIGLAAGMAAGQFVPEASWTRIGTIGSELESGTMNYRSTIWALGIELFNDAPLLGVGAGNFGTALENRFGVDIAPHNVFLAIAVEYGLLGFALFMGILWTAFYRVPHLPVPERRFWYVLGAMMFLAFMSMNWEWRKQTWLVLGLAAVHGSVCRMSSQPGSEPVRFERKEAALV